MTTDKVYTTRSLYGLAKSPELNLDNDNLHAVVFRVTGKASIKELTQTEVKAVVRELVLLKEMYQREASMSRSNENVLWASDGQRFQIRMLEKELGWNTNPARLKGFMKKFSKKENIKWLTAEEASKLIEGLKGAKRNMNGKRSKAAD